MKFLEGKTPAERNKTIAAIVLGFLAIVALAYTFLFSGGSSRKTTANGNANSNSNSRSTAGATNTNSNSGATALAQTKTPEQQCGEDPFCGLTPIPDNPFPPVYGNAPARNIFAFYEPPPPPPPAPPKPSPIVVPSPPPPPPLLVQSINPQAVYANQGNVTLDVGGDKFTPDTKIFFNGAEIQTEFQSAQRLVAQVPAQLIAQPGQPTIMARSATIGDSNQLQFNVQAPPTPNYNFVGLVARKRFNNDTAVLQDKQSKQLQNVRLGETVGRFKVVSISSEAVVMQDTQLNFRHTIAYLRDNSGAANNGGVPSRSGFPPNNGYPAGIDPTQMIQPQPMPPGFPNQVMQPPPQPQQQQPQDEDDDDGDNL